jgi:hypothetical protein
MYGFQSLEEKGNAFHDKGVKEFTPRTILSREDSDLAVGEGGEGGGSAEKDRSYVGDEEIRLIFLLEEPATQRSGL